MKPPYHGPKLSYGHSYYSEGTSLPWGMVMESEGIQRLRSGRFSFVRGRRTDDTCLVNDVYQQSYFNQFDSDKNC